MVILGSHGKEEYYASKIAAPIFKEITEILVRYNYLSPSIAIQNALEKRRMKGWIKHIYSKRRGVLVPIVFKFSKEFLPKTYSLYDQLVSKFNQNKVKLEQL